MIINQANLQGIYKSFSTIFNQALDTAKAMWDLVAMQTPSKGESVDYKWLGEFPTMKEWGFPVVIDASHSIQKPGGEGVSSGGDAGFIPYIAKAGVSVGADGIFLEIHDNPSQALSDKYNSLKLKELKSLLRVLLLLEKARDGNERLL